MIHKMFALQQKVSLYTKWFHWMLSELISHSEQDLVGSSGFTNLVNRD